MLFRSDADEVLPALAAPKPSHEVAATSAEPSRGRIEVALPDGTTLRVDGDAEHGALRIILASLSRRS